MRYVDVKPRVKPDPTKQGTKPSNGNGNGHRVDKTDYDSLGFSEKKGVPTREQIEKRINDAKTEGLS